MTGHRYLRGCWVLMVTKQGEIRLKVLIMEHHKPVRVSFALPRLEIVMNKSCCHFDKLDTD